MFHQLRCLDILRKAIVTVDAQAQFPARDMELSQHCVNYLRQMVLCRTDMEREVVIGKDAPESFPSLYECRDWTVVYKAVENNQREHSLAQVS
ncbi:hypothetical protein HGRIS_006059 [Hohenbuehelia grisea]|uniref:Uncharacterized protein n=1 Tax=Hohenbuehelia grisea TaxID=104357 RepID=A0ABR3K1B1_9AGAR